MAMEVVVLIEFEAGAKSARAAVLQRVGALALTGRAKLSFVATEAGDPDRPDRDVVAIGLASAIAAPGLIANWRSEGILPDTTRSRILQVQPVWSMEPLAMMFP